MIPFLSLHMQASHIEVLSSNVFGGLDPSSDETFIQKALNFISKFDWNTHVQVEF